jgi:hypothetical protein
MMDPKCASRRGGSSGCRRDLRRAPSGYGFATLEAIEIHLEVVADYSGSKPAAILFVDDADQLAQAWISQGVDARPPEDKEWGLHEGELIDLDGNIIRFGSPLR